MTDIEKTDFQNSMNSQVMQKGGIAEASANSAGIPGRSSRLLRITVMHSMVQAWLSLL